jgi:SAM-dependent methyltransferase
MSVEARTAGPGKALEVRAAGDEAIAAVLSDALHQEGKVERATHGFHTYPAGLHPDAARILIAAFPGAVHDPFCGGGTVLVEAILQGRKATGGDLSSIALLVAGARTADPALASPLRADARRIADEAKLRKDVEVPEALVEWYEPHVAQEIGRLRDAIPTARPEVQRLLWAVLSSIVVKASFRESDTTNVRVPHHRPPGSTAILFHKKARELGRRIEELPVEREVRIKRADARADAPKGPVGLILTSPPYPGVYDYLPLQQLRNLWLGIEPGTALAQEIGSRRSFRADRREAVTQWRDDTARWIARQSRALDPKGSLIVVVGDGLVAGKTVDALSPTVEALRAAGLEVKARASVDREDHARARIRTEHLVCAQP